MFIVGSCMMMIIVKESNNDLAPQVVTNTTMDLRKVDTNSVIKTLPLKTNKDTIRHETQTQRNE